MYVHLSDAAVVPGAPLAGEFGRVENTRGPVHAEQIRQWCGNPDAQITVNPVIDLNEHIDVEAYEIRGRLQGTDHPDPPHLRVPLVHQTRPRPGTRRARRRLRPPDPLRPGPAQLLLQRRPPLPAASPGQDPRPAGPTPPSNAGPMCGPARTATSTSATTTAPSTSAATGTPTRRTPAPTPRTTDSTAPTPRRTTTGGDLGTSGAASDRAPTVAQPSRPGSPGLDKLDQRISSGCRTGSR